MMSSPSILRHNSRMISRRQFLIGSAGVALIGTTGLTLRLRKAALTESYLVAGHSPQLPPSNELKFISVDGPGNVSFYDLNERRLHSLEVGHHIHHVFQAEVRPQLAAGSTRWGPKATILSLKERSILHTLSAPTGLRFFGHGLFSGDGRHVLLSANDNTNTEGFILLYEVDSGRFVERISTGGVFPHEFYRQDEETLVVTNERGIDPARGELVFLHLPSGKIVKRFGVPHATHLRALAGSNHSVGSSVPEEDLVSWTIADSDGNLRAELKRRLPGESLSLGFINDDILLCTTGKGRRLLAWEWEKDRLAQEDFNESVLGLQTLGDVIYVTTGLRGRLQMIRFDVEGFRFHDRRPLLETFANGSHLSHVMF